MNDEQFLLANAYVDGELTDDERRIASADPDVMAEVERLRALRAELRAVPTPSADVREAAIGAAMAEFRATGAAEPTGEPGVVPLRPRPAYAKYLAVAAALVAVAGLGIVVSQTRNAGDDDAGGDFEDAAIAQSSAREDVLITVLDDAEGDQMAEAESAPAVAGGAADALDEAAEMTAESTAEEAIEEAAEEGDAAMDAGPEFGADESMPRIDVPPDFDPDEPILNEIGLAVYGSYLLDQRDVGVLGPTPETRCSGNYEVLDRATYVLDGDDRDVYIAVNEFEGFVLALETENCTELAQGDLF